LGQVVTRDRILAHLVGARQQPRIGRARARARSRTTRKLKTKCRDMKQEVTRALRAATIAVIDDLLHDQRRQTRIRERASHVLTQLQTSQRDRRTSTRRRPLTVAAATPRARIQRTNSRTVTRLRDPKGTRRHINRTRVITIAVPIR